MNSKIWRLALKAVFQPWNAVGQTRRQLKSVQFYAASGKEAVPEAKAAVEARFGHLTMIVLIRAYTNFLESANFLCIPLSLIRSL